MCLILAWAPANQHTSMTCTHNSWADCDTTCSNVTGAIVIRSTWYAMQDSSVHTRHVPPYKAAIEHMQWQCQHQCCARVTQLPDRVLQFRLNAVT